MLGDRTVVQADKAELPLEILLWRKCECHQDTDLGDSYSKFAAHGCPEARQKQILEFLRACYNNKDYAHVLHQLLFFPEQPG